MTRGQAAGNAIRIGILSRHGPVADVLLAVIAAEAVSASSSLGDKRFPEQIIDFFTCGDLSDVREIGQCVLAGQALDVLEKDELMTVVAMKDSHDARAWTN